MMGPNDRRNVEAFADAFDGRKTALDAQTRQLVEFAENLCAVASAQASPEFVGMLRTDLMREAASVLVISKPEPAPHKSVTQATKPKARRRLATVATGLIATTGCIGIIASSASALPGEMLYPVKQGVESVQSVTKHDDAGRGQFELKLAQNRLDETQSLVVDQDTADAMLVTQTLESFTERASTAAALLLADYSENDNVASARMVGEFAVAAHDELVGFADAVPTEAQTAYDEAEATLRSMALQTSKLCNECADLPSLRAAVSKAAKAQATPSVTPKKAAQPKQKKQPQKTPTPTKPKQTEQQAAPIVKVPDLPTSTLKSPDVVGPVTGLLLGNDDQTGLVPGLLGVVPRK